MVSQSDFSIWGGKNKLQTENLLCIGSRPEKYILTLSHAGVPNNQNYTLSCPVFSAEKPQKELRGVAIELKLRVSFKKYVRLMLDLIDAK